jgi:ribosomal protein L14E/L6E/L27E
LAEPAYPPGTLVRSLAGRDLGSCYVVLRTEGQSALVANGDSRPVERPKPKNMRHLLPLGSVSEALRDRLVRGDRVSNAEVQQALTLILQAE